MLSGRTGVLLRKITGFTSNDDYKDFLASQEGEGTVVYLVERDGKVLQIQVDRGGFLAMVAFEFHIIGPSRPPKTVRRGRRSS